MEEEIAKYEAQAAVDSTNGFRNHLWSIWEALELDERPNQVSDLIRHLLRATDPKEQLAGLAEVERSIPPLVRQALEQCREDHRRFTVGKARAETDRERAVLNEEILRLDVRMEQLERLLTPYWEQVDLLAKEYQDKLDHLCDARRAIGESDNRAKGAAVARLFHQIVVMPYPKSGKKYGRRLCFHLRRDEAVPGHAVGDPNALLFSTNDYGGRRMIERPWPYVRRDGDLVPMDGDFPMSDRGDPWTEDRYRPPE